MTDDTPKLNTTIVKPPATLPNSIFTPSVFLAGSIEMGVAVDWQKKIEQRIIDENIDCIIFNPRRDEWDASWEQTVESFQFQEQVTWELAAQEKASIIFMYLAPGTQSPISLLELGLFHKHNMIVVCPPDFYRRGNVEIVCNRYGIPIFDNLGGGVNTLISKLKHG